MVILNLVWACLAVAAAFMSLMFLIARYNNRRYDLVDVAWGLVFIVIALFGFLSSAYMTTTMVIVLALVVIWGGRLSRHIYSRWSRSQEEDPRYVELRKSWPKEARSLQVYVRIYLTQALLATIVSLPVIVVMHNRPDLSIWVLLGVAVWGIGFWFEATADRQLKNFLARSTQRSALMQQGLWKYSRHPNYFGEMTQWFGIALMSIATPLWWLALLGAVTIAGFIVFVSGVPPAERRAAQKPGWKIYKDRTSVIFPMPPKKA